MRLLFGAEPLLGQRSGVGRYAWQLYQGLLGHSDDIRVDLAANGRRITPSRLAARPEGAEPQPAAAGDAEAATTPPRLKRLLHRLPGYLKVREMLGPADPSDEARWLRRYCRRPPADALYHEPNFVLRPFNGPAVTTIHDLTWLHYPDYVEPTTLRILERGMPQTLRRAARIITVSAYVAAELGTAFGVPPERIRVTPLGVESRFRPRSQEETRAVLARHDLVHDGYLLFVSTLEPRKNLRGLLAAHARLPHSLQERFPLVLVGGQGWDCAASGEVNRLARTGRLRNLGYVPDEEMPQLYAGASVLAMPSFYEGFGLPVLEAMASGTAVLMSDRGALPEVAAGAAAMISPDDVDGLTTALEELLADHDLRGRRARLGVTRASAFSWQRTVLETLSVYHEVLGVA